MSLVDVSIILVNYNTKQVTLDCLTSIFQSKTKLKYEVILTDNASVDDSVKAIATQFPQVKLIKNKSNSGFGVANNQAAAIATGRYLWILNSDTILESDTLDKLVHQADQHNSYISTCQLLNPDGSLQPQGGALPTLLNLTTWMLNLDVIPLIARLIPPYQAKTPYYTPGVANIDSPGVYHPGWIGGTAALIRRDLYMSLAGFDEHIFMYGEDVEFCLRASLGNIGIDYFAKPQLIHLGQASGSSQRAVLGEIAGLKYIYRKHKLPYQYFYLRFILKVGTLLRLIIFALTGDTKRRDFYAKAFQLA